MRRATAVLSAAAVVLWTVGALAQAKPSFSGSWTPDAEKTAAANPNMGGGGGRGGGMRGPMSIKQDNATFTIERQGQNGPTSITYKLDGSPMEVTTGRGQAKATAKWEGATIVVEQVGANGTTKTVYSIEGDWLVTTTTAPGRGGGDPTTTKAYYKKG